MASLSTDKRGNRTIQFMAADRKRRSIRLGKMSLKTAREIRDKVQSLNGSLIARTSMEPETAAWVGKLPAILYDKLANAGLVPKRLTTQETTLGAYLEKYI